MSTSRRPLNSLTRNAIQKQAATTAVAMNLRGDTENPFTRSPSAERHSARDSSWPLQQATSVAAAFEAAAEWLELLAMELVP
jgi:hypothetical protein